VADGQGELVLPPLQRPVVHRQGVQDVLLFVVLVGVEAGAAGSFGIKDIPAVFRGKFKAAVHIKGVVGDGQVIQQVQIQAAHQGVVAEAVVDDQDARVVDVAVTDGKTEFLIGAQQGGPILLDEAAVFGPGAGAGGQVQGRRPHSL
jgi:hypothetical protein